MTKDGKTKVKATGAVLSTAEAISVLFQSGILAQSFGFWSGIPNDLARSALWAQWPKREQTISRLFASTSRPLQRGVEVRGRSSARPPRLPSGRGVSAIDRVHLFPGAHHSPRTSAVLSGLLARIEPSLVLVEGPSDAAGMMGCTHRSGDSAAVALLAYRTDGTPGSTTWPFAAYSPEYVAVCWARAQGKTARFIDINQGNRWQTARPWSRPRPRRRRPEEKQRSDGVGGCELALRCGDGALGIPEVSRSSGRRTSRHRSIAKRPFARRLWPSQRSCDTWVARADGSRARDA